jgi:MoaA/NifB/PqqE/SkfB family radical SAM enzyme
MYKIESRWGHQNSIKVEWNLGKRCNYDCSYCPSSIHDNNSPHTDVEILKSTVDKLMTLGKPIRLSFTGGEPTVHPKFKELLQYCKHVGISWISVTTNGTLPFEFYNMLPIDQLVFSVHFEYDWMRVCNTLMKVSATTNISVIAQLMAHHDYMIEVKSMYYRLKDEGVPITIRRIRWTEGDHDLFDDMRYDQNDLDWILENTATVKPNCVLDGVELLHANDIIKLHKNKFKGWSCNVGLESLMINWDGDVHRATCREGGSLGNIYVGTFNVPTSNIKCTREFCTCAADIPITKTAKV